MNKKKIYNFSISSCRQQISWGTENILFYPQLIPYKEIIACNPVSRDFMFDISK